MTTWSAQRRDDVRDCVRNQPSGAGQGRLVALVVVVHARAQGMGVLADRLSIGGALAANIIPSTAVAELDLRLVPGNDVTRQVDKLRKHIKKHGFHITDAEPTDAERQLHSKILRLTIAGTAYNAQRTPMDLPIAKGIVNQVQLTTTDQLVLLPSLGGSLPLYLFEKYLNSKPVTLTIVNYDNNQHAENENLVLRFLWEGIESVAFIMAGKY